MNTYGFTVVVDDVDDETIDRIAGKCPDSGVGTRQGTTLIDFDRDADSLGSAIDSALSDLRTVGVKPLRVLVDIPQKA